MTEKVPAGQIERIVGANRRPRAHVARADTSTETVYILHSEECLKLHKDLRHCRFSTALDRGIDLDIWEGFMDKPVSVYIDTWGQLSPARFMEGLNVN